MFKRCSTTRTIAGDVRSVLEGWLSWLLFMIIRLAWRGRSWLTGPLVVSVWKGWSFNQGRTNRYRPLEQNENRTALCGHQMRTFLVLVKPPLKRTTGDQRKMSFLEGFLTLSFLPLELKAQRGITIMVVGGRARCQLSHTFSFNFLATILKFLMHVPHHKAHPWLTFGDDPTNGRACMHAHAFSLGTQFFGQFLSYGSEI